MTDTRNWMDLRSLRRMVVSLGFVLALAPLTALAAAPGLFPPSSVDHLATGFDPDSKARPAIVGQLVSFGTVTVDGRPTINGSSIPSNSLIAVPCGPGNSAIVKVGQQGLVEVRPGARIRLTFSDGLIGGELIDGTVRMRTRSGVRLDLLTPQGRYAADGQKPLFLPIKAASASGCSYDQVAAVDNNVPPGAQGSAATGSAVGSSGLSPLALAALIFSIGVAGAITIVALTDSGEQVSPTTP